MELRVLGPLEVVGDDGPVALRGSKPRDLLALLAVRANRCVAPEVLVDELWHGAPPDSAGAALRVHIARVRRALEPGRLDGMPSGRLPLDAHGYRLVLASDETDASRFEQLVGRAHDARREGYPEHAEEQLAAALELWRGPAYAGIDDLEPVRPEAARLDELRVCAMEERFDALLELGAHERIVHAVQAAVAVHPLRERLTTQLVVALYRSGRHAEALAACSALVRRLDDELGVEPSVELRDLERAVLLQRPELDWRAPTKPERSVGVGARSFVRERLIGRDAERTALLSLWNRSTLGERQLALVTGPAGIGKSALVEDLARHAEAANVLVARGWCDPDPVHELQPFVGVVQTLAGRVDLSDDPLFDALVAIAPALGSRERPADGDGSEAPTEARRYRLFEAIARLVAAVHPAPCLVVLEDVHWAGRPVLQLLRHLVRHAEVRRLLVVATCRDSEGTSARDIVDELRRLVTETGGTELALHGFDVGAVRALIETSAPPDMRVELARCAETVRDVTGGSPFYVREVLHELAVADDRSVDAATALAQLAPSSVRALVGERVARLTEPARDLLSAAAVIGIEFALPLLAAALRVEEIDALVLLDEASNEALVNQAPNAVDRFRFAHAIVRNAIYAGLTRVRRARLHRAIADALTSTPYVHGPGHAAEIAHHFVEAVPTGARDDAVRWSRSAGEQALAAGAYDDAVRWLSVALELSGGRVLSARDEGRTQHALGLAYEGGGRVDLARDAHFRAADLACATDDPDLLVDAALGIPWVWGYIGPYRGAVLGVTDDALAVVPPDARRVKLQARVVQASVFADARRATLAAQDALALAEQLDDPGALNDGLIAAHNALVRDPGEVEERLAFARRAVAACRAGALRVAELGSLRVLLADLLASGLVTEFDRTLDTFEALARHEADPHASYWSAALRATQATFRGELTSAEQLVRGALVRGEELSEPEAPGVHLLQTFAIRYQQGRLAELSSTLTRQIDPGSPFRAGLALHVALLAETGKHDAAVRALDDVLGDGAAPLPPDAFWLAAMCLLAGAAAEVHAAVWLQPLEELLARFAGQVVVFGRGGAVFGTVDHWLAELALARGDDDRAVGLFERACARAREMRFPYWVAAASIGAAQARHVRHADAGTDCAAFGRLTIRVAQSGAST